jgi:anti-sigma regulatory factor (Ser/Thr protein kinase)
VNRLMAWIDDMVQLLNLSSETAYALQLCLEEVVANIVRYAFEPGTAHDVRIVLRREAQSLLAEVTDDGRPFDPLARELPQPAKDLASTEIGGLGIKLIRSFADHIVYQRDGSLNRLMLSFATAE